MNGEGLAVFDPHGNLVAAVRASLPERRVADVLCFNLSDPAAEVAVQPAFGVAPENQPLAAANLIETFGKIWSDA